MDRARTDRSGVDLARREGKTTYRSDPLPWAPPPRLPFVLLLCFIATQGHLVPVIALPLNWVLWPSLPDIFGALLILSVFASRRNGRPPAVDREILRSLLIMLGVFLLSLALVTVPVSETGDGVRFGAFSVILLAKYIAVFWAVAHIPIDEGRQAKIHGAALIAYFWLAGVVFAEKLDLIELSIFVDHLPTVGAGKWTGHLLDSTVGTNHGGTAVVLLILVALIMATARYRVAALTATLVVIIASAGVFIGGSRQGLVRLIAFIATFALRTPARLFAVILLMTALTLALPAIMDSDLLTDAGKVQHGISRQETLIRDPFSSQGLSGRPELWASVFEVLDEKPHRYLIGYGIGNYVEFRNSAHNMFLQMLQDAGIIGLAAISWCLLRIFRQVWRGRAASWPMVALTAGMLTSCMTSAIFYPNLGTGWYLGFYFICLHITLGRDERTARSGHVPARRVSYALASRWQPVQEGRDHVDEPG